MPTYWINWLTRTAGLHLGNFNQHWQWLLSPLRASVTFTNNYLFYIAVILLYSAELFSTYSSTVKGYVALGLLYLQRYYEFHVSSDLPMLFHNQPLIFFSNTFGYKVCHAFKTGARFLRFRYHIHIFPFLPPHSSHISKEPMYRRLFCRLVAGCSGRMLGFRFWCFWPGAGESCDKNDRNLFQCSHQPIYSGGNHNSHDKRYAGFHCHNMAFIS